MAKVRIGAGLVTGCLVTLGGPASALAAPPTAVDILRIRPKQDGVSLSTPAPQEQEACTVKLVPGVKKNTSGWLVSDPQGRPLRLFLDTVGDKKLHQWSYYHEGTEVYREIDSDGDARPDQYRWLNSGGMKWGVATNDNPRVVSWKAISAEEVSQEVLQAVVTRDATRLQALWLTDAELRSLDLPAEQANKIRDLQKQAYARFQNTLTKLGHLNDKTRWIHLETGAPHCVPADALGGKQDLIKYDHGTILCETAGKHDFLQTGALLKVGDAWRVIDAPSAGGDLADAAGGGGIPPEVQALLDELRKVDAEAPKVPNADAIAAYNLKRSGVLRQVIGAARAEEKEQWIRQLADCLSAASQGGPEARAAYDQLAQLEAQVVKTAEGSPLAAYVAYRVIQADMAARPTTPKDIQKLHDQILDKLAKFVNAYSRAEDAPEALMQLGLMSETADREGEAKKWYEHLAKSLPEHPLAAKARGAVERLDIEGKPLTLAGPTLDGGTYSLAQAKGRPAVVYYWESGNPQCVGDFAKLKLLLENNGSKLTLVTVSLDNNADEARKFAQRSALPVPHLHQPGGLDSPLAVQYGIQMTPHLFVADADGKVVSRNAQVSNLDDVLRRLVK